LAHFGEGVAEDVVQDERDPLAALVSLIAEINAWNRLNVITRRPGGDYQPGERG
jgi:hypothetical protein